MKPPATPEQIRGRALPQENGCHLWTGARHRTGYGKIWSAEKGDCVLAHRWFWEQKNGPVPDGLVLHHACEMKLCVNPEHLVPVTRSEHLSGAIHPHHAAAATAERSRLMRAKTHCPQGHEYTPENTAISPQGARRCRAGAAEWQREWRLKHPDKVKAANQSWRARNADHLREYESRRPRNQRD